MGTLPPVLPLHCLPIPDLEKEESRRESVEERRKIRTILTSTLLSSLLPLYPPLPFSIQVVEETKVGTSPFKD